MSQDQTTLAKTFKDLHAGDAPLILPNAWDAGSARLMEHIGSKSTATTSAGVAWAHGYQDGDQLPVHILISTIESIARVVSIPVSVDIEGGYSSDPTAVGETAARVIGAGAVGINIEDGSGSPDLLCRKIEAVRRSAAQAGVPLFINARTDVHLRGLVDKETRTSEVTRRSALYRSAGADGLFVPLLMDATSIGAIANGVALALNVMACPGLPPVSELGELGVRRLSIGSAVSQAVFARMRELAEAFLRDGDSDAATSGGMPFPDVNGLFSAVS
ncbi:MAG: isocitrate lyase/phosphoenolpyruvate mutase family protein [Planctomycetota bacterium]